MKLFTLTTNELAKNMNSGKDVIADTLEHAGVINSEQARTLREDFALLLIEKGMLGHAIDKVIGQDEEDGGLIIKLIQVHNIKYNNKEKNEDAHQSEGGDKSRLDNGSN